MDSFTVLVVDDTPSNLLLMKHLAGKVPDVTVVAFSEPLAALEWMEGATPDLILVDYMMPDIDGLEFLRRVRANRADDDIPVVVVTTSDEREVMYRALQLGATEFLTKPFDAVEFEARLRNMLALRRSSRLLRDRNLWLTAEVAKATREVVAREEELIHRMSKAAEFRDPETGSHLLRMAHYSRLIAEKLGLSWEVQETLFRAAPMHDIGKMGIPDGILLKPGRLDAGEFELMKEHTRIGYAILRDSDSAMIQLAAEIAFTHHEKFDGSGYPRGLRGDAIPLAGRIVAVADVFDALTTTRPYKPAWTLERAAVFIKDNSGSHFDPNVAAAFLAMWPKVVATHRSFQDQPATVQFF